MGPRRIGPNPDENTVRILVLGARGMMGHMACRVFAERHQVFGTTRTELSADAALARFLPPERWVSAVDAEEVGTVRRALESVAPDAVLNCIGIVKQAPEANDPILSITVNSLFPHQLAALCNEVGARMVHLSTDCVFSGLKGGYTEQDTPDPVDLYGRSKLLGETEPGEALTLRTSVVGREIHDHWSLFEWVLASRRTAVRGFDKAIYSGVTTRVLAEIVERIFEDHRDLTGVWQVASEPITKYRLVGELNDRLDLGMEIARDASFVCDRSLHGAAFATATGIEVPSWEEMLDRFVEDQPTYEGIGVGGISG